MLVLTRKCGESIRVADEVVFTILECAGGQVRVGITAPPQLPIHREEVYHRIREENLASAMGRSTLDVLLKSAPEELRKIGQSEESGDVERPVDSS
ncbi:MAG: carbon storage regulator CsrA [Fidelibacterota bacterium]|nr:MAG: carbon storage regulator CsrA [Candidatus Neomarinimicrobiota bacterium]